MKRLIVCLYLVTNILCAGDKLQTFTAKDGRSIQAHFIRADQESVTIERPNVTDVRGRPQELKVPLEMLSPESLRLVKKLAEEQAAFNKKVKTVSASFPTKFLDKPVTYVDNKGFGSRIEVDPGIYQKFYGYVAKTDASNLKQRLEFMSDMVSSEMSRYQETPPFHNGATAQRYVNYLWIKIKFAPLLEKYKSLAKAE